MNPRALRDLRWTLIAIAGLLAAAGLTAALSDDHASSAGPPMWRVLAALGLCIALAVAGAWALKVRLAKGDSLPMQPGMSLSKLLMPTIPVVAKQGGGAIEVLQTVKLGSQLELSLLSIEGQRYLIGSTAQYVTLLKQWTPAAAKASPP